MDTVFDMVGEIEDFIDNSSLVDVWVEYCGFHGFHGFIVHYNHCTRSLEVDAEELFRVIRGSEKTISDDLFLKELDVNDYLEVCTVYKRIYLRSKKIKINKLYPDIEEMLLMIGVKFYVTPSMVFLKFNDGKVLMLTPSIFNDLFKNRLGYCLGMYKHLDLYQNIKGAISDFKNLRARSI